MKYQDTNKILIDLWLEKSQDAFSSAKMEYQQNHLAFTVNRLYYSCFYALTALLLKDGLKFSKHSAVISEFNKNYIKNGRIDIKWGRFYQKLFYDRQQGDYLPTVNFEAAEISQRVEQADQFLNIITLLIRS